MTGGGAHDGQATAAREMRILADILALTLDEQPGVADAALANIKARAREGGVTAGALKEAWRRLGAPLPEPAHVPDAALARTRMEIATLQSQVGHAEALRRADQQRLTLELRQARLVAMLGGAMAGAAITAVVYALAG